MAEFIPDCWITACNTLNSIHAGLLPDGPLGYHCEITRGYDPRVLVMREGKQPDLVTHHQIIGLAHLGNGQ